MPIEITSTANARIKETLRLEKRGERDRRRSMLIEGAREVERALAAGVIPREAYVCRDLLIVPADLDAFQRLQTLERQGVTQLFLVSAPVYARLVVREQSGGILLIAPYLERALTETRLSANPFVAVIEGVEKPGNLGAILRSADGAGVDLVIVTQGGTDIYNPNVVRASLGALFTVPVVACSTAEAIDWLKSRRIKIIAASPEGNLSYTKVDMT
jgi:TrmH family RNA methyltransferase